jgi:aspartate aminotransferase
VKEISLETHVDSIRMPENVKIGLMVSESRKKCLNTSCPMEYYGLAFGQSPFHVPEPLVAGLIDSARFGSYSAAEGITELRQAISDFNLRHFNLKVDPSRIIVGPGTKQLLHMIFDIIEGDVIIPSPSWIGYFPQIKLLNKHFHTYYLKPEFDFKMQPENLADFVSKLHKEQHILVINNPHNPTGALYSKRELEKLASVCRDHNIFVVSDEIYALTTYNFEDFTSMGLVYPEGTFVTNGLSKDRSAGGYRLGSCILPENSSGKLAEAFRKVAATIYTNVSTPIQFGAIRAYEPNEEIEEYIKITRQIHQIMGSYMSGAFNKIDGISASVPKGGFYFFADFNAISDYLVEKGVKDSNALMYSLISHPFHIATISGDTCLLDPNNFGARIAFVDYDGKKAFDNYKTSHPKTLSEEEYFVKHNAPLMVRAIDMLKSYVQFIKSKYTQSN